MSFMILKQIWYLSIFCETPDWWFSCFKDIYIALVRQYFLRKVLSLYQETQYPLLASFSFSYEHNIYMIVNQSLFLKICNIHYSELSAYFIDNGNYTESLILSLIMFLVIWGFNVCYTCNWIQWQNEKLLASNPNYVFDFIIQNS